MQCMYVSILSYMEDLKIQVIGPKALIDVNMLCQCFTEAFEEMKEASIHRKSLWVQDDWDMRMLIFLIVCFFIGF